MSLGLCFGGVGIGKCGKTVSEQHVAIVNTAVASAYFSSAFSCSSSVQAGNSVITGGYCTCAELGIVGSTQCLQYQIELNKMKQQACDDALNSKDKSLSGSEITCICHSSGAGCSIGIDQKSLVSSQVACTSKSDVKTSLESKFADDVISNLSQIMKDVGGVFDSNDQKVVSSLASHISDNISDSMIDSIASSVNTGNISRVTCGGLNFGITQYSHYTQALKILSQNSVINQTMSDIANQIKTSLSRKDEGFTAFFEAWYGILLVIVVVIVLVAIAVKIATSNRQKSTTSASPSKSSIELTSIGGSRKPTVQPI